MRSGMVNYSHGAFCPDAPFFGSYAETIRAESGSNGCGIGANVGGAVPHLLSARTLGGFQLTPYNRCTWRK